MRLRHPEIVKGDSDHGYLEYFRARQEKEEAQEHEAPRQEKDDRDAPQAPRTGTSRDPHHTTTPGGPEAPLRAHVGPSPQGARTSPQGRAARRQARMVRRVYASRLGEP